MITNFLFNGKRRFDFTNANIVCDGNSLTMGYGDTSHSYPIQLAAMAPFDTNGALISNFGVGGQTTEQMIADAATQVDSTLTPGVTNICIAWETLNGVALNAGTAYDGYMQMVNYYKDRKAAGWDRCAVMTIISTWNNWTGTDGAGDDAATFYQKLLEVNTLLRSGRDIPLLEIIDVGLMDHLKLTTNNFLNTVYYQADKVHLTQSGYGLIANAVYNWLRP